MTQSKARKDVRPVLQKPISGTYARAPIARVVAHPEPVLSRQAADVDLYDPSAIALARTLVATMHASPACVGLAAPQIGIPLRMFCMDVTGHKKARSCAGLVVVANPRIVARRGNVVMREGCMSVPHFTGDVARAEEVEVMGVDPETLDPVYVVADGIEARCLLHEIDHLDGYLFVDRVCDPTAELFARKRYA